MKKTTLYGFLALLLLQCATSQAAIVTTVLTLDPASPTSNRLSLNLLDGASFTDLVGTIIADIDIDLVTGEISSINLTGGSMTASAWSMNVPALGGLTVSATQADATADTIPALSLVTGTTFAGSENQIQLTSGEVIPGPEPLAGVNIIGSGNGSILSMLNGGLHDIEMTLNIDDTQIVSGQNLNILGSVVARSSITAIPEPSGILALTGLACGVFVRRRRR